MPALFLCSIPPSLGWLLIGGEDFLEVTNQESGAEAHASKSKLLFRYKNNS